MIDEKTRSGFYNTAGKGKEASQEAKPKPQKSPESNKTIRGENNLQKMTNYTRGNMPEGHDHNDYGNRGHLQMNSYNNRIDPQVLEDQRKMRENRKLQLKYAKDRVGVKTRHESAQQDKLKEGFAVGQQKVDRVSGMAVVNPTMRNSVPVKELNKRA